MIGILGIGGRQGAVQVDGFNHRTRSVGAILGITDVLAAVVVLIIG